jgi:hypothetical protein
VELGVTTTRNRRVTSRNASFICYLLAHLNGTWYDNKNEEQE